MSFHSVYAGQIWEDLYNAYVPDFVTMNRDYIRKFGVPSSGNKDVDKMMSTNLTFVKIPIIKILEHYDNGIVVEIPSRQDMIAMHKAIEVYLQEWRDHLTYDLNSDKQEHKTLILGLEKLSKLIFDKAYPREVMDTILSEKKFGLLNVKGRQLEQAKEYIKPDYNSISALLKPAVRGGRYGL